MKYIILLVALSVFVSACNTDLTNDKTVMIDKNSMLEQNRESHEQNNAMEENEGAMMKKDPNSMDDENSVLEEGNLMNEKDQENMEENKMMQKDNDAMMKKEYSGMKLAGVSSPYLEFDSDDYERALNENKIVVLYFYAKWCPTCRAEQPQTHAAFDSLTRDDIVGFRVNYRDDDTDKAEEELAKKYGISYQHTKVILKNGDRVLKSLETWNKERYLEEFEKV